MRNWKLTATGEAWFMLIAGLILGTVFTVGERYWYAPIPQENAIAETAIYQSCQESTSHGHLQEMKILFENHAPLYIKGACLTRELLDDIHALVPGTELTLLVHPNSGTILELRANGSVLLAFQDAVKGIALETNGFFGFGLLCYCRAAYGLLRLPFWKKR